MSINTHKQLIKEIELFSDKFDLIRTFKYIKDADSVTNEIMDAESRVFIVGLESMDFDSEYNTVLRYNFAIANETIYDADSIIQSETDNIICVSALDDYLNHISNSPIDLDSITFMTEQLVESTYTSIVGGFSFVVKRSASYWKEMEQYSV